LGSYAYAGQYQQSPVPREGGMVKEAWLSKRFESSLDIPTLMARNPMMVVQSYDCASKPKEHNDPTARLTLAIFKDHYELWNAWQKRVEFPEGQYLMKESAGLWNPAAILIEDKDAGQQHIQQLRKDTNLPVVAINPGNEDKGTRMMTETPQLEAGKLWLPEEAEWLSEFVTEVTTFTGSNKNQLDNQVDALSQFLRWVRQRLGYFKPVAPTEDAGGGGGGGVHTIGGYDG
jgi:predicted phage terminase large subunit-like protein